MDWSNKPYPFKRYAGLPRIGLEREAPTPGRRSRRSPGSLGPFGT
jgi:hypothetical protein